jgi:hypothetical protein
MNIFKKYRVKEINGKFIAQCKDWGCWEGISAHDFYLWFTPEFQKQHCSFNNLEDAIKHIEKYKESIKKPKTKYYY